MKNGKVQGKLCGNVKVRGKLREKWKSMGEAAWKMEKYRERKLLRPLRLVLGMLRLIPKVRFKPKVILYDYPGTQF